MRERFRNWMRTPSLRGQLIWLSVSSVLVTLLISLLILVLLISNVMGPFVNREAEFAMQTVSRSLSTKTHSYRKNFKTKNYISGNTTQRFFLLKTTS